jgi:hypothetical protein
MKVTTHLPATALWLLVIANMLFAGFAIMLMILALRASSPGVHQVYTRFTITGTAAQLFDRRHWLELFNRNSDLFACGVRKRVGVTVTKNGGAEFLRDEVDAMRDAGRELDREEVRWELVKFRERTACHKGASFR